MATRTMVITPLSSDSKTVAASLRERFNFASAACAALVLYSSPGIKSSSAILNSNKDAYMLVPCHHSRSTFLLEWLTRYYFPSLLKSNSQTVTSTIVVELCSEIRIDTILLSNEEYFSSSFQKIRLSGASRYGIEPIDWKPIALLEGSPLRGPQIFNLLESSSFVKYLKFDFESFYGNEFYSPLTLLAVYGTTMIDDFRAELSKKPIEGKKASQEHQTDTNMADGMPNPFLNEIGDFQCMIHSTRPFFDFEDIGDVQKFKSLFKSKTKRLVSQFIATDPLQPAVPLDIIGGNNIFKFIIDRVGFLENQTEFLATQLKDSNSEIRLLRDALLIHQENLSNTNLKGGGSRSVDSRVTRFKFLDYLHDLSIVEDSCNFHYFGISGFGILLLVVFLLSFILNIWAIRRHLQKKGTCKSRLINTQRLSPISSSTKSPFVSSTNCNASPQNLNTPVTHPVLDPDVLIFPAVDPSLTKSSLLKTNGKVYTHNITQISPSSPLAIKGHSTGSFFLHKGSELNENNIFSRLGKNTSKGDIRGQKRSQSLPPFL